MKDTILRANQSSRELSSRDSKFAARFTNTLKQWKAQRKLQFPECSTQLCPPLLQSTVTCGDYIFQDAMLHKCLLDVTTRMRNLLILKGIKKVNVFEENSESCRKATM